MKKGYIIIVILIGLAPAFGVPGVSLALTEDVGIYENGGYIELGSLTYRFLEDYDGLSLMQAYMQFLTPAAMKLDTEEGYDFRWILYAYAANYSFNCGNRRYSAPWVVHVPGGCGALPHDEEPFWWDTADVWPYEHIDGEYSFFSTRVDLANYQGGDYEEGVAFLVLYHPNDPKKVVFLENGYIPFRIDSTGFSHYLPEDMDAAFLNSAVNAAMVEETIEFTGFPGDWEVIPTCETCGFTYSMIDTGDRSEGATGGQGD